MSTNPFETIAADEHGQIEEIAELMKQLLQERYGASGDFLRGVHPKSHGCLSAKFEVLCDIEKELKVGLFAESKTYEAIVRFSNADSLVRHDLRDGENGSRGMAVKVLGVDGALLYDDHAEKSQDFLMINTPRFAFANIADYLRLQKVLLQFDDSPAAFFAPLQSPPPSDPDELAAFKRTKQSFDVVSQIKSTPVANPLEVAYFGAAPFLFGKERVMHVSAVPQYQPPQVVPDAAGENYLREALTATMAKSEDVVFEFRIQVRKAGEDKLHIEDATQFWPAEEYPPQAVARLTISAPQQVQECENRFFTPWHALAESTSRLVASIDCVGKSTLPLQNCAERRQTCHADSAVEWRRFGADEFNQFESCSCL